MDLSLKNGKGEENDLVEDLTVQDTVNILNALSREELIELVQEAAAEHRYVRDQVRSFAVKNTLIRKLFVRGLGPETNDQSLAAVFSAFGELDESCVIRDKRSGRSKGYGFVLFKHVNNAIKALKEPSKMIGSRIAVCQFAPAGFYPSQPQDELHRRKIYVGNVPVDMEAGPLVRLFSQYGEIEEGPKGFNKNTGRSSGYAIFIFKTVEAANRALEEPIKLTDDGHQLYCKLANENPMPTPDRVNSPTHTASANGLDMHQLGFIPGQGFGNPAFHVNQGRHPFPLTPYPDWPEPNFNPNHAIHNDGNSNAVSFNIYQYGVPEYVGYPAEGYGYTRGVQASPGSPQLLLTEFMEEGNHPGPSNQSQYQNQQKD